VPPGLVSLICVRRIAGEASDHQSHEKVSYCPDLAAEIVIAVVLSKVAVVHGKFVCTLAFEKVRNLHRFQTVKSTVRQGQSLPQDKICGVLQTVPSALTCSSPSLKMLDHLKGAFARV
jgi:hypothetical protein